MEHRGIKEIIDILANECYVGNKITCEEYGRVKQLAQLLEDQGEYAGTRKGADQLFEDERGEREDEEYIIVDGKEYYIREIVRFDGSRTEIQIPRGEADTFDKVSIHMGGGKAHTVSDMPYEVHLPVPNQPLEVDPSVVKLLDPVKHHTVKPELIIPQTEPDQEPESIEDIPHPEGILRIKRYSSGYTTRELLHPDGMITALCSSY